MAPHNCSNVSEEDENTLDQTPYIIVVQAVDDESCSQSNQFVLGTNNQFSIVQQLQLLWETISMLSV